jgi:hypothetical protein
MNKLQDILTGIRTLPNLYEAEALDILRGLCARFKENTLAGDAILDAVMVIENHIEHCEAEPYQSEPRGEYDSSTVLYVGVSP